MYETSMRTLLRFSAAIDRTNDRIGVAIRWLVLLMVIVGAFNALARYATGFTGISLSSNALYDLQWYMFALVFLLGAAYGLNKDVHVRVDVLYSRLSERGQAWIDLVGSLVFLLPFCVMMLWVSWPAVWNSWRSLEASLNPGGLPLYPIKTIILPAFFLLFLQGVSQAIKQVECLRKTLDQEAEKP